MNLRDRTRTELAVQRYDFWLDLGGVPRRQRRSLTQELRANLHDAAEHEGLGAALLGIGSPRTLAHASTTSAGYAGTGTSRPRWAVGGYAATAVFAVLLFLWLCTLLGFLDGVSASGVQGPVEGSIPPWGSTVTATAGRGTLSLSTTVPWLLLLLPLLVFLLAARAWRAVPRRRSRSYAAH